MTFRQLILGAAAGFVVLMPCYSHAQETKGCDYSQAQTHMRVAEYADKDKLIAVAFIAATEAEKELAKIDVTQCVPFERVKGYVAIKERAARIGAKNGFESIRAIDPQKYFDSMLAILKIADDMYNRAFDPSIEPARSEAYRFMHSAFVEQINESLERGKCEEAKVSFRALEQLMKDGNIGSATELENLVKDKCRI